MNPATMQLIWIVAVEYKNQLAFTFHPELTDNTAIHRYFLEKAAL